MTPYAPPSPLKVLVLCIASMCAAVTFASCARSEERVHISKVARKDAWSRPRAEIEGVVTYVRKEADGDIHVRLELDGYVAVLEIVPELPMAAPKVGQRVLARGVVRWDLQHNWGELHPLTGWSAVAPHSYRWAPGAVTNQLALYDGESQVGAYRLADGQYLSLSAAGWSPASVPAAVPAVPQVPFASAVSTTAATYAPSAELQYSTRAEQARPQAPTGTYAPAATGGSTTTSSC